MISSLALLFLVGLLLAALCRRLGLPGIIGLLVTGMLMGPCGLDLLDESLLAVSADLRQIALIIILLKAGLSLDPADLKRVGRPAVPAILITAPLGAIAIDRAAPLLLEKE